MILTKPVLKHKWLENGDYACFVWARDEGNYDRYRRTDKYFIDPKAYCVVVCCRINRINKLKTYKSSNKYM